MVINDNEETVTCRLCGENHRRLYGKHFQYKHKGMTANKYRELFPDAPITIPEDMKNTTKNSGKHMKQEKYKKMFSDMFSGEKNPNHKTKTTEQERKERSPSCIEFYDKNYPELNDSERIELLNKHVKDKVKERLLPSHKEYWLNKGYTEEEAKNKVSERQTTFSREICIEKHGYEKGIEIFNERTKKWNKSLIENGNLKSGYSLISQKLFDDISNNLKRDFKYATNNGEFSLTKEDGGVWLYDFVDVENKKIIEYQGDIYHANPKIYEKDDKPHPYKRDESAFDIWKQDEIKKLVAIKNGYDVLYIWDSDYNGVSIEQKNEVLKKCIEFLND